MEKDATCRRGNISKAREGPTYKNGTSTTEAKINEIPLPRCTPTIDHTKCDQLNCAMKCFWDIETTSLSKDADMFQIAAIVTYVYQNQ